MIDFINNSALQNVSKGHAQSGAHAPKSKPSQAATSSSAHPKPDESVIDAKANITDMAKNPPIDLEAVGQIKEAIARGNYPVDLDKIADKLMESFMESRG